MSTTLRHIMLSRKAECDYVTDQIDFIGYLEAERRIFMTVKRKQKPVVNTLVCAACGECSETCPRYAITIQCGTYASIDYKQCVGCGACAVACPASAIKLEEV